MPRALPRVQPGWRADADVVVVGSGAAGVTAALAAAGHGPRVLLLSKEDLGTGCTPLAQGGLAAAIGQGDSAGAHQRDTLAAGAGLCDPAVVAALAAGAPEAVDWLCRHGARLERDSLHLEGGHSARRILHAGGDAVGAEVHRVLMAALADSGVQVLTGAVALDALMSQGEAVGLTVGLAGTPGGPLRPGVVTARAVVLATGGLGQVYATTSNPAGACGDGLALATRAGAQLRDVEFVQFHPTVLWLPGARGQCPLITEALRGAGAVLVDACGRRVMAGAGADGDLAPRDVVAAAMWERMAADGTDHLWLDATALGRRALEDGFPTVTAHCRRHGVDPVTSPIPVAPGAHYACGGIRADLDGVTSVPGLYAVGEAAATGAHGANRLASNSVTEALIAGRRAGELVGWRLAGAPGADAPSRPRDSGTGVRARQPDAALLDAVAGLPGGEPAARGAGVAGGEPVAGGAGVRADFRPALAAAMSRDAGVMRDHTGLSQLLGLLAAAPPAHAGQRLDLATVEATSLHTAATLIAAAALARGESRGCHRRRDHPETGEFASHTLLRWHEGTLSVWHSPADREAVAVG